MPDAARSLTAAFVLVSYTDQAPAAMERATAALAHGLRELGHGVLILSAASRMYWPRDELRLDYPRVGFPCPDDDLRAAILAEQCSIEHELDNVFDRYDVDVAVYGDALWGLGRVAPTGRVRTVLAMHVVGHDEDLHPALDRADLILAPSPTVLGHAVSRGYDTKTGRSCRTRCCTSTPRHRSRAGKHFGEVALSEHSPGSARRRTCAHCWPPAATSSARFK
jgi:iron(II)-dependent oxidoreductase